jgi:outer membrane protein OmpA-like peptidoglycan-associated protein
LTLQKLETGKTIPLKNIYFEFDKDELMPRSFVELNKLLKIMRANPKLVIEIVGHTDALGDDAYNLELSRRRALSVVQFLQENKINKNRLRSHGEGESKPVASNETEEGRAHNRRVEFVVVKK